MRERERENKEEKEKKALTVQQCQQSFESKHQICIVKKKENKTKLFMPSRMIIIFICKKKLEERNMH